MPDEAGRGVLRRCVEGGSDEEVQALVMQPGFDHRMGEAHLPEKLLYRICPEGGARGVDEEAGAGSDVVITTGEARQGLLPALAVFHFDGDEAPLPGRAKSPNENIEGRAVAAETKIATTGRVLEQDFADFRHEARRECVEDGGRRGEVEFQGAEEIEDQRLGRK